MALGFLGLDVSLGFFIACPMGAGIILRVDIFIVSGGSNVARVVLLEGVGPSGGA